MSRESSFYLQQVAQCARDAEAAVLPNQREMFLRSQSAWQALADRRLLTEQASAELEAQRREQITAADRARSACPC